MSKLLIIDGNSILNRAFYGIRPLTTSAGLHTNALFGVLNILLKQIGEIKPDYAAIAYDLPAPTFRHKEYAEYKAGRKKMPEELAMQLPYSKKLAELLGITVLTLEGYEADDILGTVSKMAEDKGIHSYILTGDKDSLQLISDDSTVLLATNNDTVPFDRDRFFEKYGVEPKEFIDVKALMGDSSDNIPGVPGIGEKTALKLIADFHNIDNVYENIENAGLGKSAKQKMLNGRELAYTSKWLATIERNAPVGITLDDLKTGEMQRAELHELLRELEFTSHIKRLNLTEELTHNTPKEEMQTNLVTNENGQLSFDMGQEQAPSTPITECSLSNLSALIKEPYALAYDENEAAFCTEKACFVAPVTDKTELFAKINGISYPIIAEDSKKLLHEMSEAKITDDITLMAYVCDPARSNYAVGELAEIYLHNTLTEGVTDRAIAIYGLREKLKTRLDEEKTYNLYKDIELPLAEVLCDMEKAGFKIDTKGVTAFGEKLLETEKEYTARIYGLAGKEFNINSPKQLGVILFDELGLKSGKKTQKGYSTSAEVLESLRDDHPIINEILEYRAVAKLRSTYTDALVKMADGNGRIHTVFSQTTAVTGRLASSEPNLQNIPVRTELGREMRRFFIAGDESRVLIDADYSQIELRILAHIADDEVMKNAFISGQDVHAVTASQVFNVPLCEVTGEMRKRAKAVNFGIVYGIGELSLAKDIGVSRKEAGEYIKSYFEKYHGISEYLTNAIETAREKGYAKTIFGRKRYIPELKSAKGMLVAFGERVAMNSPIQGSSADIIKMAMINVSNALKKEGIDARLILQIHDELIVEAHRDCAERAAEILRAEMENVAALSVPLTVDLNIGNSWYECK